MNIIYVDDEKPALDNFIYTTADFPDVESVKTFQSGTEALEWIKTHKADIAFLDIEMSDIQGVELARRIYNVNPDIRVVFVTAYSKYAIDAFGINTIGYVLKPYSDTDIRKELDKLCIAKKDSYSKVVIGTMPDFVVRVDGKVLNFGRQKVKELFALLIDRGDRGISSGEAIAYLWPDKPDDAATKSLFRVTLKRLVDILCEYGIVDILDTSSRDKHVNKNKLDCDLYRILDGDAQASKKYHGYYLREYSWAEEMNALLTEITGYVSEE